MRKSVWTRLNTLLAAVVIASISVPAFAQSPASSPASSPVTTAAPTFTEGPCAYKIVDGLTEGKDVTCGTVTAPMYYDRSSAESVTLPIVRIKSTSSSPAEEPLVMLQGGPGQSLEAWLPTFGETYPVSRYLLERQDVILFDQRGMGKSSPNLACMFEQPAPIPGATPVASPVPAQPGSEEFGKQFLGCGDFLREKNIDFTAFTSKSNAADVNSIRVAMGFDKMDLYGVSYGSRLAQEVMRDYPDTVRAAVITSPLPLEANPFLDQYIAFDRSLKEMYKQCAADADCNSRYPDLEKTLPKVIERLKSEPMKVMVKDPASGKEIPVPVNDVMFLQMVYLGMFIGSFTPYVPVLITTVAHGDDSVLKNFTPMMLGGAALSLGAVSTYWCQEEAQFDTPEKTADAIEKADIQPFLKTSSFQSNAAGIFQACKAWKFEPNVDAAENLPAESNVPVLIVTGRFDPITPPSNGDQLHTYLPQSQVVVMESQGHDPLTMSGTCGSELFTSFINDPSKPVNAECAAEPIDFSPDRSPDGTPIASPAASPAAMAPRG